MLSFLEVLHGWFCFSFSVIAKQCADLVVDVPFIYKFIGELLGVMAYGEDICLGIVKGDTQHNKSDLQRSENPVTQLKKQEPELHEDVSTVKVIITKHYSY